MRQHPRHRGRAAISSIALAVAGILALAACSPTSESVPTSDAPSSALRGNLTIFAAASLTASFTELATDFSAKNPGVTVNPIFFDGSSTLATQINEGAPADVFASADEASMQRVKALLAGSPMPFASNVLQIAVQPGNPLGITGLVDLAKPGVQVVLCAPEVPCGAASHKLLNFESIALKPVSEEQNVKAVLTKVQLGEADAGLVYVTDIKAAAGAVDGVTIAGADRARNIYPIAVVKASTHAAAAKAFVNFVLSDEGRAILAKYGFSAP